MAESNKGAKHGNEIVVIEPKPFAITPKSRHSFTEGFFEAEHYYRDVVDWLTKKIQEVNKERRIFVYSLEGKSDHLQFWHLLTEASKHELVGQSAAKMEKSEREKPLKFERSGSKSNPFCVRANYEGAYQIFHFTSLHSKEVRDTHVHCEVRVVMPEKVLAKKKNAKRMVRFDTAALLSKFNASELMKRRTEAVAQANAVHTKASDDALENILTEFEKLSF